MAGTWEKRLPSALLASALALAAAPSDPARAQPPAGGLPRFGLAHVDVMDLHVARDGQGRPQPHEVLPAADLADRFVKATAAGARWDRWSMYWDLIEAPQGRFDWGIVDAMVERDRAAGMRTLAILQGTPGFAADAAAVGASSAAACQPSAPDALRSPLGAPLAAPATDRGRCGRDPLAGEGPLFPRGGHAGRSPADPLAAVPRGLDGPIFRYADGGAGDDPSRAVAVSPDQPWALFVATAVARYRPGGTLAAARGWSGPDGVRHWEIGNEPNLSFFWSGSAAEYARYLQVADLVVHFVDPAATVVHGGIADTAGAVDWYRRFLAALAARAPGSGPARPDGGFFDAAAWHWYTYPRELAEGPASARSLLAEHGLSRPIWVTEMGVPVWDDYPGPCWDPASPHRATQTEQSAYLWQAMTEAVASDVAVTIAFQAYDDCGNGPASYDAFGLVRNHASNQCWQPPGKACWRLDPALAGTPRPAFDAYRVAARELAGASLLWRPAAADGWQRILFYRPPGERVMVLWNTARETRTVEVYATGPGGTVLEAAVDGRIAARSVAPSGGKYTLRLPGATNRNTPGSGAPAMAGHPVFVVEHDAAAPFRSEIAPLPPVSPTTFDLVARAADGGTGVGAVQLWTATVDPAAGGAWTPLGDERPWPANPLSGEATFPFVGDAGVTYYFAASARDRAGNAAAAPAAAQAVTRIDGAGPTAAATAPAPAATRTPTAPPTQTAVPSASPTPTPIHVVARLYLPVARWTDGPGTPLYAHWSDSR